MSYEQLVELIEKTGLIFFEMCLILLIIATLAFVVFCAVLAWKEAKKIVKDKENEHDGE